MLKYRKLELNEFDGAMAWLIKNEIPYCNKSNCKNCNMNHYNGAICGCIGIKNYNSYRKLDDGYKLSSIAQNLEIESELKSERTFPPFGLFDLVYVIIRLLEQDDFITNKCMLISDTPSLEEWEKQGFSLDTINDVLTYLIDKTPTFLTLVLKEGSERDKCEFIDRIFDTILYNSVLTSKEKLQAFVNCYNVWEK